MIDFGCAIDGCGSGNGGLIFLIILGVIIILGLGILIYKLKKKK